MYLWLGRFLNAEEGHDQASLGVYTGMGYMLENMLTHPCGN